MLALAPAAWPPLHLLWHIGGAGSVLMLVLWACALRTGKATIVDPGWSFLLGTAAVYLAVAGSGDASQRLLVRVAGLAHREPQPKGRPGRRRPAIHARFQTGPHRHPVSSHWRGELHAPGAPTGRWGTGRCPRAPGTPDRPPWSPPPAHVL